MSQQPKAPTITFKCPKCGRVEKHVITKEDLHEIKMIGIARLGFIHGDHSLIINFDPTGFIRGAYIIPSDEIPTDIRVYFKEYRIICQPRVSSDIELIMIDDENKIIDIRLSSIGGKEIVGIMNYLDAYGKTIGHIARRVGICGKSYNIIAKGKLIAIFSKIPLKHMGLFLDMLNIKNYNPTSALIALRYIARKKSEDLELDKTKKRLKALLYANEVQIRAKKGINAIRFARASIIALWPELEETFDTIIKNPQIMSGKGMYLHDLLSKNPGIDVDNLFDMLKELRKRDLIEVVGM